MESRRKYKKELKELKNEGKEVIRKEGNYEVRKVRRKEGKGREAGRIEGRKNGRKVKRQEGRKTGRWEGRPLPGVRLTHVCSVSLHCAGKPKGNFNTRVQRVPIEDTRACITSCCPQSALTRLSAWPPHSAVG